MTLRHRILQTMERYEPIYDTSMLYENMDESEQYDYEDVCEDFALCKAEGLIEFDRRRCAYMLTRRGLDQVETVH